VCSVSHHHCIGLPLIISICQSPKHKLRSIHYLDLILSFSFHLLVTSRLSFATVLNSFRTISYPNSNLSGFASQGAWRAKLHIQKSPPFRFISYLPRDMLLPRDNVAPFHLVYLSKHTSVV
ncbi:unnamed protein product, partial [Choristocarpus tenellus]